MPSSGKCKNCNGTGKVLVPMGPNIRGLKPDDCPDCNGTGIEEYPDAHGESFAPRVPVEKESK